ncbi:MAG: DUF433 domain-containing protein [Myxococcales bacterium]|nr:DUF433 domain-containing protein [Myxococcales bacterium]
MSLTQLPRVLVPHPHVRTDVSILSGSPHVAGSKVPVRRLWAWHRGGTAVETLMRRYPNLGPGKILDALSFAYDNIDLIQADIDREPTRFDARGRQNAAPRARPLAQLALPFAGGGSQPPPSSPPPSKRSRRK